MFLFSLCLISLVCSRCGGIGVATVADQPFRFWEIYSIHPAYSKKILDFMVDFANYCGIVTCEEVDHKRKFWVCWFSLMVQFVVSEVLKFMTKFVMIFCDTCYEPLSCSTNHCVWTMGIQHVLLTVVYRSWILQFCLLLFKVFFYH